MVRLSQNVLGTLYLQDCLILRVDAVNLLLGQLLEVKQLHQNLKQQEVMALVHCLSGCCIKVVLLDNALEHLHLLEFLF